MNRYSFLTITLSMSMIFLTWCSTWKVEQEISIQENAWLSSYEKSYSYWVDHTKRTKKTHNLTITPHSETVKFFTNSLETEILSYGTGLAPLVIRAQKGDLLSVTLDNQLTEPTTLHRHGVRVPHSEDGVPGLTQDPVPADQEYTYTIPLHDAGTYWFHTHIDTMGQIGRWLYGIIVVEEDELPEFDQERIWALKDYRLDEQWRLLQQFGTMSQKTHAGYLGNVMTVSNIPSPTFTVLPGEDVLIRILNPSNARFYNLDFSDWDVEVVESDGGRIKSPYKPTILQLWVGERYTLLRHVPDDFNGTKALRDTYYPRSPNQLLTIESLDGSKKNKKNSEISYDETLPDWRELRWKEPSYTIHLGGMGVMWWDKGMGMNGNRGRTINDQIRPHTNSLMTLQKGEMTIVRLQNDSSRDHPMHLHGDFFQVIWVNGKQRPYAWWKDTVNVPAKGYLDLAIIPTNIGTRMFHCHINEHAEYGMMATINVE